MLTVLIVDDYAVVREGRRATVNAEPDMTIVAEGRNGQEGVEMVQQHEPAVTLMELRMPVMKGIDVIEAVRRQSGLPQKSEKAALIHTGL